MPSLTLTLTRRDLRLASGLVLVVYVATHLLNHALGLVSLDVAESGLNIALAVWQSLPGTVLLYGAAAVHLALAFDAIYHRRTLRMPPMEMIRIVLGLGIPTLLIGHIAATRVGYALYDQSPHYHRVVWALWRSDLRGRQLALLVPGWLHGCLGVHYAFSRRPAYQRLRPVLIGIAMLLPVLGALGFLEMGKELAADIARSPELAATNVLPEAQRLALGRIRDTLLTLYFSSIALVFALRHVRLVMERRRHALVNIGFPQRAVQVPRGWSVLDASRSHHLAHLSMCGGRARCSTCRVRVTAGDEFCPPPGRAERATLQRIRAGSGIRLACQLRPLGPVSVVPLLTAELPAFGLMPEPTTEEYEVALLQVRWLDHDRFAAAHLPQDVVFLSRLFNDAVAAVLRSNDGDQIDPSNDRVSAVFGMRSSLPAACRQVLAAGGAIENALAELASRIEREFDRRPAFRICIDAGSVALGEIGYQSTQRLAAAGPLIDRMKQLATTTVLLQAPIVVTRLVFDKAGVPAGGIDWQDHEAIGRMRFAGLGSFSELAPPLRSVA